MVTVYDDKEALSLAAARLFAEEARRAVEKKGEFDVLLSGGETPRRTYEILAEEPLLRTVPWHKVHLFWGDERYVPLDDNRSNFGMTRRALLDRLAPGEPQVHPVPYEATPHDSAQQYEKDLRRHFNNRPPRFDLVLLGLGQDGHTASLFPESPALAEDRRWVSDLYLPEQDMHRITVTPVLLNEAALVVFLVSGSGKALMLRRVLQGERDPREIPAQAINPSQGRLMWLVDRDAAALLSNPDVEFPHPAHPDPVEG